MLTGACTASCAQPSYVIPHAAPPPPAKGKSLLARTLSFGKKKPPPGPPPSPELRVAPPQGASTLEQQQAISAHASNHSTDANEPGRQKAPLRRILSFGRKPKPPPPAVPPASAYPNPNLGSEHRPPAVPKPAPPAVPPTSANPNPNLSFERRPPAVLSASGFSGEPEWRRAELEEVASSSTGMRSEGRRLRAGTSFHPPRTHDSMQRTSNDLVRSFPCIAHNRPAQITSVSPCPCTQMPFTGLVASDRWPRRMHHSARPGTWRSQCLHACPIRRLGVQKSRAEKLPLLL